MTKTEQLLNSLVSFPTVSRDSNIDLIHFIRDYLSSFGIDSTLIHNDEKTKANLYATLGQNRHGGVMLSGHTDVVPTDGQYWTKSPFKMEQHDGKLYGRGTADMKGFIAAVLALVPDAQKAALRKPIHLAFSYDEEIGCVGVRRMIEMLASAPERPDFCIIGEPTRLDVAIAHKGKTGAICRCYGLEGHSALATKGLNAIYLATEIINEIKEMQKLIIVKNEHDIDFGVPYTTLHVGTIQGGTALNIIPNKCEFKFEIRNLSSDDPMEIMDEIIARANKITAKYQTEFPQANIEIEIFNEYPALNTAPDAYVVQFVQSLLAGNPPIKLDFGTEGGLFQNQLHIPTVVCGPGSMDQGHKPDEFVTQSQLAMCDEFLQRLLAQLC